MRSVVPALVCALLSAPVACSNGTPPPAAPTTVTLSGDGGVESTASTATAADPPPSADGGPDFYSCGLDSDCVAVAKASCCPNGFLEAVNKQSADAYRSSFACEKKHRLCPQFRVLDKRQALCGNESHRCEMVPPDHIACSGTGANPHACPSGWQCDATGHCAAGSP